MTDENAGFNTGADGKPVALEAQRSEDGRRFSPSVGRNRDIVRQTFAEHMPLRGPMLEIGSGTGEHGVHIVSDYPDLIWTFTDLDEPSLASPKAWRAHMGRADIDLVQPLDASARDWGAGIEGEQFVGVFSANVIHISPIEVAAGLFSGAARVLTDYGRIFLYGPFGRDGVMSDGNTSFDADLKRRDQAWGVRDLEREILPMANASGFAVVAAIPMPKNNLSVVFARS